MSTISTYDNMLIEHKMKTKKTEKKKERKFSPWTKIGVKTEGKKDVKY